MEKTQYLNKIREIERQINRVKMQIYSLKLTSKRTTQTLKADKIMQSKENNGIGIIVEKIIDLENELEELYQEKSRATIQMNEKFYNLSRLEYQLVLGYRYIDLLEFKEIAQLMNFSLSYIFTLHKKSLKEFEI